MNEDTKKLLSATATPLASIFGSGFLVIVPILAGAVGPYAWLAMACVCGLAYAMGSVIRFNIRDAENARSQLVADSYPRRRDAYRCSGV
jgi:hypothetical protein